MTWVLLVGGPKNGQRFDVSYVGKQVRYHEDDEDGGRYVWLGSSGEGRDLLYVWEGRHDACACGHERMAHCDACIACDCLGFQYAPSAESSGGSAGGFCPSTARAQTTASDTRGQSGAPQENCMHWHVERHGTATAPATEARCVECGFVFSSDHACCGGTGLLTDGVTSCPVCTLDKRRTTGQGLFASTERSRPAPFPRFRAALPHELDGRLKKSDIPTYIERVVELELVQGELRKRLSYAVELMEKRRLSKDEQDFVDHCQEEGWV